AEVMEAIARSAVSVFALLHLGHEEDVVTRDSAFPDCLTDHGLGAVVTGGVDQAVSEAQSGAHGLRATPQLPGSEPHRRNLNTCREPEGLDARHVFPPRGARKRRTD